MPNFECADMSFGDFQATKTTLPEKIIQLRRISQENHVRRMKLAHQRKQMEALNAFSVFSPANQGKQKNRTPFTTPGNAEETHNLTFNMSGKGKKLSYNDISPGLRRRVRDTENHALNTPGRRAKHLMDCLKDSTDSDLATEKNTHNEKMIKMSSLGDECNKARAINQNFSSARKTSDISRSLEEHSDLDSTEESQRSDRVLKDSLGPCHNLSSSFVIRRSQSKSDLEKEISKGNQDYLQSPDFGEISLIGAKQREENSSQKKRHSRASKIPISLLRLGIKDERNSSLVSNCTPKSGNDNNITFLSPKKDSPWKESPCKRTPVKQVVSIKENYIVKGFDCDKNIISLESHRKRGVDTNHLLGQDSSPNKMSSVSNWLNSFVNCEELGKYSDCGSNMSFVDCLAYTMASNQNTPWENGVSLESRQTCEDSRQGIGQDQNGGDSESEQSEEEYYDIEETPEEVLDHYRHNAGFEWAGRSGDIGEDQNTSKSNYEISRRCRLDGAGDEWSENDASKHYRCDVEEEWINKSDSDTSSPIRPDDAENAWTKGLDHEETAHYRRDDVEDEEWAEGMQNDDSSTVNIPSDKDLELETHREANFRELPDYPNTPYNLRYPRYRERFDESVVRSDGKEMSEALRQLRYSRFRKKTCNSTPRRKMNVKVRKNKKRSSVSRKKYLFE